MKKALFAIGILMTVVLFSCKGKKEDKSTSTNTEQTTADNSTSNSTSSKLMTITAIPDSAVVGKKNEIIIKVKNFKAVTLSNPDGKVTGLQLTYDIQATNRNSVGSGLVTINPSDFRLELDNGTKISHDSYNSFNVDADATASSTDNIFKLDPGTKPVALDVFYDQTRAVIKLNIQ